MIVDSCGACRPCRARDEICCEAYPTTTFDGIDRIDGTRTRGGYADSYVADEHVVYRLPEALDPAGASPLLCAGVEVVGRSEINVALDRLRRNDVRFRFVIDMGRP